MLTLLTFIPAFAYTACVALPLIGFGVAIRGAAYFSQEAAEEFDLRHRASMRDYYRFGCVGVALLILSCPSALFPEIPILQVPFLICGAVGLLLMILWPVIGFCIGYDFLLRARETPPGHCAACGYDLRGTTSESCSECGASTTMVVA